MYYVFSGNTYKVHRNDVTVIETETGKKSGDTSEEELLATMRKLGINKLEVSDDEIQRLKQA